MTSTYGVKAHLERTVSCLGGRPADPWDEQLRALEMRVVDAAVIQSP